MGTPKQKTGPQKVLIVSAYDDPEPITSFLLACSLDKIKHHQLVSDPALADLILFVENSRYHADYFFKTLKNHPLVKAYPEKVFMYNAHDKPWLVLPGLYASMPKRLFNSDYIAAVPYVETINPYINYDPLKYPDYLFSFTGNPNSSPRRCILNLTHERGIVRSSESKMFGAATDLAGLKQQYAQTLIQSKYVLCPRGAGTSSFRIFETMQAGRIPVIISDDWVAPEGPRWDEFALFVAERDINRIPSILEEDEKNWYCKSQMSRQAWETFFAPDVIFNYLVDRLICLKKNESNLGALPHVINYIPYLKYVFRVRVITQVKLLLIRLRVA